MRLREEGFERRIEVVLKKEREREREVIRVREMEEEDYDKKERIGREEKVKVVKGKAGKMEDTLIIQT